MTPFGDVNCNEAFRILCNTLHMPYVLDEDGEYFVDPEDECVYEAPNKLLDDRGKLFIALRKLLVIFFLKFLFRIDEF